MAMTAEEKRAYNKEYYQKYRKKGIKKGRKKGKGTTKKTSLIGLSTAGLNDNGKMQWALKKQELQEELNAKLANTTDPYERKKLIKDYQSKAFHELQKLKSNPYMSNAKKSKASGKSSGGSGSSGGSRSSGGSKSSDGSKSSGSSKESSIAVKMSKSSDAKTTVAPSTSGSIPTKGTSSGGKTGGTSSGGGKSGGATTGADKTTEMKQMQNQVEQLQKRLENGELDNLSEEKRAEVRTQIQAMIDRLRRQMNKG